MSKFKYAGVDIGGTKCAVCIGNEAGDVLLREEFPTFGKPPDILEKLADTLRAASDIFSAIGISCGGPLDSHSGLVLSPANLPGWDRIPVTEFFSERFGVPAFIQNDANACALAEWMHGAGRGSRNMMFCTMGTGFGCGLILDGRLYEGSNGNAGELGHVRLAADGPVGFGKAGSVEGFCSGNGIAQLAELRLGKAMSARAVAEEALAGDEAARAVCDEVGEQLGRTLAVAVDFLNLDRIVIGSIFQRSEKLIRPAMERVMQAECLGASLDACRVVAAELGDRIGDVAAITVAQNGAKDLS